MTNLTKQITWQNVQGTQEQIKSYVNNYARDFNVYTTNLAIKNGNVSFTTYDKVSYEDLVVRLIRKQYPTNEEFAILRKALTEKTNEFYIYNSYVEECKLQAKAFIEERNKALGV